MRRPAADRVWRPSRQERSRLSHIKGIVYRIRSDPSRTLTLGPGTYTGSDYGPNEAIEARQTVSVTEPTAMQVSSRAIILGRLQYRVDDGPLAGYWLPATSGVSLR